ncbi:MAG: IS1595 family transposase [Thermodesulfobacteriota bacterium]|nr:IS1595 family transposase [Thermodesulfobacteriota bacterium]
MEKYVRPLAGIDYPQTFQEFDAWFATEDRCRDYLRRVRWPSGFQCPRCGSRSQPWITARGYLHCRTCQGEISVTAGTMFERLRKPLRDWFLAIWFVSSQKQGVSALGLQRVLGLVSYQTAWTWLHKLRRVMVRPGRDRLTGAVEVDETYVGGPEEGVHGRETEGKAIVVVAAEIRGRGTGRIRWQIESRWADHGCCDLPLFTHITPRAAAEVYPNIPKHVRVPDFTRILWFPRFRTWLVSHTIGLDVVYLSAIAYSAWSLFVHSEGLSRGKDMDPVSALLAIALTLVGVGSIRSALDEGGPRMRWLLAIIGSVLVLVAVAVIVIEIQRTAQQCH